MEVKKLSVENNFKKIYNTQEWYVKAAIQNNFTDESLVLISENISYIEIVNSLDCWVPKFKMRYTDFNFSLSPILRQTRSITRVRNARTVTNN
jgi:hypothetical protein